MNGKFVFLAVFTVIVLSVLVTSYFVKPIEEEIFINKAVATEIAFRYAKYDGIVEPLLVKKELPQLTKQKGLTKKFGKYLLQQKIFR